MSTDTERVLPDLSFFDLILLHSVNGRTVKLYRSKAGTSWYVVTNDPNPYAYFYEFENQAQAVFARLRGKKS